MRVEELHRALVISTGKNSAWVALDGESIPRIAQLRRMSGRRSMPVPGDVVHVRILEDERVVVDRTEPRGFSLERRTADGRAKTIAANVDMLVTVTAMADPAPRLVTLDQLLAFSELQSVAAAVVFTKPDLGDPELLAQLQAIYHDLGYPTLVINPKRGEGLDALRELIRGRRALLCGISGVGKSSIFRALGGEAAVGDVSRHGLGRQTTTTARLYRLDGGYLIDSPGVNEFGLGDAEPETLAPAFREMTEPALRCRFGDCTHLQEPDCAVREGVALGTIAPSRYASYARILGGPLPPPA